MKKRLLTCGLLIGLAITAQAQWLPQNDKDIEAVQQRINAIRQFSDQLIRLECPNIDCSALQALHNSVRDARLYMRYTNFWLGEAAKKETNQLGRIAERKAKAERAYQDLENLVVIAGSGGTLTRTLMKFASKCAGYDPDYGSRIQVPSEVSVRSFTDPTEEDRNKDFKFALNYFNDHLPSSAEVLKNVPKIPQLPNGVIESTLRSPKNVFQLGEEMNIEFIATTCLDPLSWIGIFSTFAPHVEAGLAGDHLIGARYRLNGVNMGNMKIRAPDKEGKYQLRMFDINSGKEIASWDFVVGQESYFLSGIYKQVNSQSPSFIRIEVTDLGFSAEFGWWDEKNPGNYKPEYTGKIVGDVVLFLDEVGCGQEVAPGQFKQTDLRKIAFRLKFNKNRQTMERQHYKFQCVNGKIQVKPQWDESIQNTDVYRKK